MKIWKMQQKTIKHVCQLRLSDHFAKILTVKAMDQPGHVIRFLLYRNFSLRNPISIKIKTGNWKFVKMNKIH